MYVFKVSGSRISRQIIRLLQQKRLIWQRYYAEAMFDRAATDSVFFWLIFLLVLLAFWLDWFLFSVAFTL